MADVESVLPAADPDSSRYRDLARRWEAVMMANYATPPVALRNGSGCLVTDVDGREYLDLIAGIAVSSLGHGHPALVAAVAAQAGKLMHTSNLAMHEPAIALAERLAGLASGYGGPSPRVFFCQDGTGANEAAYKLARLHGRATSMGSVSAGPAVSASAAGPVGVASVSGSAAGPARLEIVAAEGSFHGRTMGSLSITGNPPKREPFEPLPGPVTFVPYGDVAALAAAVGSRTAAVFLEPVQGEAGVVLPPPGYLAAAREICDRSGALLVVDEIQSGIGRMGEWFASLSQGVQPDVITLAKGLAGGLPLGVCLAFGSAAELFRPGDHGATFGGNPVSAAAALAVIDTIESTGLLDSVRIIGRHWANEFSRIRHPLLLASRGTGLWYGLVLAGPVADDFEQAARESGFLVNAVRPDVIRLAPPLTLTLEQADTFVTALPRLLDLVKAKAAA